MGVALRSAKTLGLAAAGWKDVFWTAGGLMAPVGGADWKSSKSSGDITRCRIQIHILW